MSTSRSLAALALVGALITACGSDDDGAQPSTVTSPTSASTSSSPTPTTEPAGTTTTAATGSTSTTGATSGTVVSLEQPAIWPAADVVFLTPEAAAESFVSNVLAVPVNLGRYMAGDTRSGEMEVLFQGEGSSGPPITRGLLLLRQLGPDDGWFVLAAVNDNASISVPRSGAEVPAGPLTIEGVARGFEGAVTVTAMAAGRPGSQIDQVLTQAGSMADPEPFTADLDLSGAEPGSVVMLLVQGGVGLETDPGDFGAVPFLIAG